MSSPLTLPQLQNNRALAISGGGLGGEAPFQAAEQDGRDGCGGGRSPGTPISWAKAKAALKQPQVPMSLSAPSSHTCPATERYPEPTKCPAWGAQCQLPPPQPCQVSTRMRAAKGCLGSAGIRESMAPCQEGRKGGKEIQTVGQNLELSRLSQMRG